MNKKLKFFVLTIFLINSANSQDFVNLKNIFTTKMFQIVLMDSYDCRNAFLRVSNKTKFQFFDASAKISDGLIYGNFLDYGNFDQCMDILEISDVGDKTFGKYCLAEYAISPDIIKPSAAQINDGNSPNKLKAQYGYCMPHQCTALDLKRFLDIMKNTSDLELNVHENYCYTKAKSESISLGTKLSISFFVVIGIILISSSTYDWILRQKDEKPSHQIFLAFSVITNGEKIFKSSNNPDHLLCLNGIKAMSMMWIILGHEYIIGMFFGLDNLVNVQKIINDTSQLWITNAFLAVDSFFFVGGLVTMYSVLKACSQGSKLNILLYYVHRYIRLTPLLVVQIMLHTFILSLLGNGPLWGLFRERTETVCQEAWYFSLFYFQNFIALDKVCVPISWYIAVDMQFYLLSPLIILSILKWPKTKNCLFGLIISLGFLIPFGVAFYYDLPVSLFDKDRIEDNFKHLYTKPSARCGPYAIGLYFGSIIFEFGKARRFISRKLILLLWIVSLLLLAGSLYLPALVWNQNNHSHLLEYLIIASYRNFWAIGLGLMIFLCIFGYGGIINQFLSLPVFQVMTKLSYAMYLVHVDVLSIRMASQRSPTHVSHINFMFIFWADLMIILFLSLLLCISFELPIITLGKHLFKPKSKTKMSHL